MIKTIFSNQFAYRCDLGDKNLVDFLNKWDKKGNGWFDWSFDLYFDKVFHVNSVLVKRIGEYAYSNPDIYLDYRTESKLLYVFMHPDSKASIVIFYMHPLMLIFLLSNGKLNALYIPLLSGVFFFFLFMLAAKNAKDEFRRELEVYFKVNGVKFEYIDKKETQQ